MQQRKPKLKEFVYYVTRSTNGPSSAVKEIIGFLGT